MYDWFTLPECRDALCCDKFNVSAGAAARLEKLYISPATYEYVLSLLNPGVRKSNVQDSVAARAAYTYEISPWDCRS